MSIANDGDSNAPATGRAGGGDPAHPANPKVGQLLDAARRLFIGNSYNAVSTDAIARAANVSKTTLYSHFASKEKLFEALIDTECLALMNDVWRSAPDGGDVRELLRALALNILAVFGTEKASGLYLTVISSVPRAPEIGAAFFESGPKIMHQRIGAVLARANAEGLLDIADTDLAARQFIALMTCDLAMCHHLGLAPPPADEQRRMAESGLAVFLSAYHPKGPSA